MEYHLGIALIISIIIFIVIWRIKKKPLLWIFLLCLSLIPFIVLLSGTIYLALAGLYSDILFAIILFLSFFWYIYILAFFLALISFCRVFLRK